MSSQTPAIEPDRDLATALSQASALPLPQILDLLRQQPTCTTPRGAEVLLRTQHVAKPLSEVFPFFAQADNLQRLTPTFLDFRILTPLPITMQVGTLIDYRIRLHGLPMRWRTRISAWQPPYRFADEQLSGPYSLWWHEHLFAEHQGGTLLTDRVVFKSPLALLAHPLLVRRELARIFDYRHRIIAEHFGHCPEPAAR